MSLRVGVVGASGYVGGELLRLLLDHPDVEIEQATSRSLAGSYVHQRHPHLRGRTDLRFSPSDDLQSCDVLFTALPHGEAAQRIEAWTSVAPRVIDLSADFRLRDPEAYSRWYGGPHSAPGWLERFTYGLPELEREALRDATHVSGVGCNATAVNLALLPLWKAGLLDRERDIIADVKVGSSEGGREANDASHHPERRGVIRSYAPTGHRHTAEVIQATGITRVHLSITAVETVRGALATCHVFPAERLTEKDLWRAYRAACKDEPFLRIVHERQGIHRHPEPRLLVGTNFADLGFAIDEESGRVVALCAIDNLGKGAAGTALQALNLMHGFPETRGLAFGGLHPL
jgi:N-acetyl-gamma-glutamyl-phosphate/LysW-gamma-L-alpha-aminoadipyl-6-phosphate reductase